MAARLIMERSLAKVKHSAGVLIYRRSAVGIEVLLVHPGGPLWRNRDRGAWQIPKGEIAPDEQPAAAARRETEEELGVRLVGEPAPLATIRQKGGKVVAAFMLEQDVEASAIASNLFELEWPPGSGKLESFPEVDTAAWFPLAEAEAAMLENQRPLLAALRIALAPAASV